MFEGNYSNIIKTFAYKARVFLVLDSFQYQEAEMGMKLISFQMEKGERWRGHRNQVRNLSGQRSEYAVIVIDGAAKIPEKHWLSILRSFMVQNRWTW